MATEHPNPTPESGPQLDTLDDAALAKWELTGELPTDAPAEKTGDAAAPKPVDQAASTDVDAKAAPETAAPEKVKGKGQKKSAAERAEEIERQSSEDEERLRRALAKRREVREALEEAERAPSSTTAGKDRAAAPETKEPEWKKYRSMPDAPKSESFETLDDYAAAMSVFIADKRADERFDAKIAEREQLWQSEATNQREFDAQVEESFTRARAEVAADPEIVSRIDPKWIAVPTKDPSDPSCTPIEFVKANVALHAKKPLAVAAYFATPEGLADLSRVCRLGAPDRIIRELAYIDARFSAQTDDASGDAAGVRQHPRISSAPAPSPTLGKKATSARDPRKTPDSFDDFDEWNLGETRALSAKA